MRTRDAIRPSNAVSVERSLAMIEDCEWMLDSGESYLGILSRLGTTWGSFSRRLCRYERADVYQRMVERRKRDAAQIGA